MSTTSLRFAIIYQNCNIKIHTILFVCLLTIDCMSDRMHHLLNSVLYNLICQFTASHKYSHHHSIISVCFCFSFCFVFRFAFFRSFAIAHYIFCTNHVWNRCNATNNNEGKKKQFGLDAWASLSLMCMMYVCVWRHSTIYRTATDQTL